MPSGMKFQPRDRVSSCCTMAARLAAERISQDRAAVTATALLQITSAGFSPEETRRQVEDYLRDDYVGFAREL